MKGRLFVGDLIYDFIWCLWIEREKIISYKIVFNKIIEIKILVGFWKEMFF